MPPPERAWERRCPSPRPSLPRRRSAAATATAGLATDATARRPTASKSNQKSRPKTEPEEPPTRWTEALLYSGRFSNWSSHFRNQRRDPRPEWEDGRGCFHLPAPRHRHSVTARLPRRLQRGRRLGATIARGLSARSGHPGHRQKNRLCASAHRPRVERCERIAATFTEGRARHHPYTGRTPHELAARRSATTRCRSAGAAAGLVDS